MSTPDGFDRTAAGFALANLLSLGYGLVRPDSLEFSLPFLVAPSVAVMWGVLGGRPGRGRRNALWLTGLTVLASVAVVTANWIRS